MTSRLGLPLLAAVALTGLGLTAPAQAQQASISFFVTSVGKGNGADLGGLAGADAHCQALASTAGIGRTTALYLANLGHHVIATGRKPAELAKVKQEATGNVKPKPPKSLIWLTR